MKNSISVFAIIQARMGSSRLPGKVLMDIMGKPAIWHLVNQLKFSTKIDKVIFATTTDKEDDALFNYATKQKWNVFRGRNNDVLDRFFKSAQKNDCSGSDAIVRLTGDDILADPEIIDQLIELYLQGAPKINHVSNNRQPSYPYGFDLEVFSFNALEKAWIESKSTSDREHVTPYIRNNPQIFPFLDIKYDENISHLYFSIDTKNDLEYNRKIFHMLYKEKKPPFHLRDVLYCIEKYGLKRHN